MNAKTNRINLLLLCAVVVSATACNSGNKSNEADSSTKTSTVSLNPKDFEKTIDGKETALFTLQNKSGAKALITNYGGRLVSLYVPDKDGNLTDVVAGFDDVTGFKESAEPYFGATIGRVGNRIAKGKFTLDGKAYTLFTNDGPNTLHGGKKGFQDVVWEAKQLDDHTLELHYLSKDMEEGFPGNLDVKVTYDLQDDNALKISYHATTDKNTVVNLTNHAFFNLNGEASGSILGHTVQIKADKYTPVDSTLIPTGKIEAVAGTPLDFTKAETIGARIEDKHQQLQYGAGYDHNYVLNQHGANDVVASVTGDKSGIVMDIYTEEPGLQFYSGNFMKSKNVMKGGHKDDYRTAFAMETQHFPDSPNQPAFPSITLKPGDTYQTSTTYKFSVKK
jgi:aldose 1-epimerase